MLGWAEQLLLGCGLAGRRGDAIVWRLCQGPLQAVDPRPGHVSIVECPRRHRQLTARVMPVALTVPAPGLGGWLVDSHVAPAPQLVLTLARCADVPRH